MRRATSTFFAVALLLSPALSGWAEAQAPVTEVGDSVYFNFQDVDLATALESISQTLGLNYVLGSELTGRVTMRTRTGIPRDRVPEVLATLLETNDLELVQSGDVFVISQTGPEQAAAGPPGGQPREIFVFFLRNADAVEMANLLVSLFGGEVGRYEPRRGLEERSLSRQLGDLRLGPTGELVRQEETPPPARAVQPTTIQEGELVGETTIVPDLRTNSLAIRTAPANLEALRETIEQLDIRPPQVLIEVVIAEVNLDEETQFGINFEAFFGDETEGSVRNFNPADQPPDSIGLSVSVFDPDRVDAVLRALATDDRLDVLSTPRIMASNNQEARILIGSEVPFVQVSSFGGVANAVVQSVQFRDVGLELIVIPRINQDREVTLEILQQNSSLSTTSFGNIDAPLITTRQAETSLVVGDRRTVVLGGLIETQQQRRESGIPLLKEIPLLGYLFKSVRRVTTKTELIITLTPYILSTDEEAEELRRGLEPESPFLRERLRAPGLLLDTVPRPPAEALLPEGERPPGEEGAEPEAEEPPSGRDPPTNEDPPTSQDPPEGERSKPSP